jgi:hypothetical protein
VGADGARDALPVQAGDRDFPEAGDLILRLIGRAKYAARSGDAIVNLLDDIPESCHGIAIVVLQDLGFKITPKRKENLLTHPLYGHGLPRSNPTTYPSQNTIALATQPLLLALQEIQFQQNYRQQNP